MSMDILYKARYKARVRLDSTSFIPVRVRIASVVSSLYRIVDCCGHTTKAKAKKGQAGG